MKSLACWVCFLVGPCTWEPGQGVPGCRGGLRPFCCVLVLVWFLRDFRRNGPIFRFTFSPAQWASPQLNGPVQRSSDRDSWLTGPYWPIGSRRKKKIHQSWDWRPSLQWTQNERWFNCFYLAPWAFCIFHWQPGLQWSTTWTRQGPVAINLMPMPVGQIGNSVPMPVGQIGNSVPMSRRLNRESPCEARGLLTPGPTSSFLG